MKKIIIVLSLIMSFYLFKNSNNIYIPKESIRYRVIANSNSYEDQKLKWDVNNALMDTFMNISSNSNDINTTRNNINNSIDDINKIVSKYTNDYKVNFGNNYFPQKEFKNIIYPEGNYESLVITLGSGNGDNWWCVMFPPLCLIEAKYDQNNLDKVSYDLYFKKILKNY